MSKRALLAGGLAVVAAGLLTNAGVPLYDGIGFPDEPYRLLPAAQGASITVSVDSLTHTNAEALFNTNEQGPQFSAYLPAGAFKFPGGTTEATFTATPLSPVDQPAAATIAGLVYRMAVNPGGTFKTGSNGSSSAVALRLPQGVSALNGPIIEYKKPGGGWEPQETLLTGADIYKASFAGIGDYALATPKNVSKKSSGLNPLVWMGVGLLLAMVIVIFIVRAHGRRRR